MPPNLNPSLVSESTKSEQQFERRRTNRTISHVSGSETAGSTKLDKNRFNFLRKQFVYCRY
jgi:hypothetical protein